MYYNQLLIANTRGRPRHTFVSTEKYDYTWNRKDGIVKVWTKQPKQLLYKKSKIHSIRMVMRFAHEYEHNLIYDINIIKKEVVYTRLKVGT
jgi:hypothetical protein